MHPFRTLSLAFALLIPFAASSAAQFQKSSLTDSQINVLPVSEVREGMRGTARTVFSGSRSEEFNVEILGVMPNWIGPKQDLIVGRLSGKNAERTFVFAGMSGSPVYIGGKLVGAISYSFPFAKEPICGITPFEQMLSVVEQPAMPLVANRERRAFSYAELVSYEADRSERFSAKGLPTDPRLMAVTGQTFTQIATPVSFSGVSQRTVDLFAPEFARVGLLAINAPGGGNGAQPMKRATETTLLGGDSVVVHLTRGDIQIAAAGTVTLRDRDKIYAFGHPFFSLGPTDLPMSESHVVTVVPNANNSFKLTVADSMVGSMTQDRATAIFGKLGQAPRMMPVSVKFTTSMGRREEINFESAIDPLLTPLILNLGVANVLGTTERGLGDATVEMTGEITFKGEKPVKLNRRFTGGNAAAFAGAAVAAPVAALLRGDFEGMEMTGITLELKAKDGGRTATLERIAVDDRDVRPGETINLSLLIRTGSGRLVSQQVPLTIPIDVGPGPLSIMVGDGSAVQQGSAVSQFLPASLGELIGTINRLKTPDRLYAVATRMSTGTIVGSSEMPNLPPSMLATMNTARTAGGAKPSIQTVVVDKEIEPGAYIVLGSQTLSVEVIR